MGAGGGAAAAAAAAHRAKLREEEERLTGYIPQDLEGWEFKIVRSSGKIVGDKFVRLVEEEKLNGWELVEKFDDNRVRFKRRTEHRSRDGMQGIEAYRTTFGLSETRLVLIVLGVMAAVMALTIVFVTNL
jgi:NADPH-dependent 2,4-dienoyl-CoA reductase/sulfur reductase-like enzyme